MSSKLCHHDSCVLSALQGMHNGFTYGAKVRFTHSLVMAILFSKEPLRARIKRILSNTLEHGCKLAAFVFIYKAIVCLATHIRQKSSPVHSFFAALIGCLFTFKNDNSINTQIGLYLFSRTLVGTFKLFYRKTGLKLEFLEKHGVGFLAVYGFGTTLYFLNKDINVLQPSLASSMKFIYLASDKWVSWLDTLKSTFTNLIRN